MRSNTGVPAVASDKELDPVQKLFVDTVRDYRTKLLEDTLILAQSSSKT